MVTIASNPVTSLSSPTVSQGQSPRSNAAPDNATANSTTQSVSSNQRSEADAAKKAAEDNAERNRNATRVTLTQQTPEPSTANPNTKPVDQYQAVSSIRS